MIHYQVRCRHGHEFDGWFKDSATFDSQSKRGLIDCPACGDTHVSRALMAPSVATRPVRSDQAPPTPTVVPQISAASVASKASHGPLPAQLRAVLQGIRAEIEKNCDYVGPDFAEEARKIHRGDSPLRGIYGEATPEQADELGDEGIDVARIPWVPLSDS